MTELARGKTPHLIGEISEMKRECPTGPTGAISRETGESCQQHVTRQSSVIGVDRTKLRSEPRII